MVPVSPPTPRMPRPGGWRPPPALMVAVVVAGLFLGRGGSTIAWLAAIWGVHRHVLLPNDPLAPAMQGVLLGSSLGCLATALLCPAPTILGANMLGLATGLVLFQLGGGLLGLLRGSGHSPASPR